MIDELMPLIKQFMPFAQEWMGFKKPPKLFLKKDPENAKNPLGRTAYYDPNEKAVTLYITGRHPKDILRSLGHELVHHKQNCDGKFKDVGEVGQDYAQTNPHLRAMEFEANKNGATCLRDFEDGLRVRQTIYYEYLQKGVKSNMSTKDWKNKEMGTLISESWGFGFNLEGLNEKKDGGSHACSNHVKENSTGREGRCINHLLSENNEVTHYTVEFDDEIVENIPVNELTELAGVTHSHAAKRDDYPHGYKPRKRRKVQEAGKNLGLPGVKGDQKWSIYKDPAKTKPVKKEGVEEVEEASKYGKEAGDIPTGQRKKETRSGKPGPATKQDVKSRKGFKGMDYQESVVKEDGDEDQVWHDWKNEHADDDHIREIEHHLRALKEDRDYERHGAEDDHDHHEAEGDPGLDERRKDSQRAQGRDTGGRRIKDVSSGVKLNEGIIEKMVRQALREGKH